MLPFLTLLETYGFGPRQSLLETMTLDRAERVFAHHGVNVRGMAVDAIKKAYRALLMKYHPDHNPGNKAAEDAAKEITAAYDVLKDGVPNGAQGRRPDYPRSGPYSDQRRPDPVNPDEEMHPIWAQAGWSGGLRNRGDIRRNDYSDLNFLRKSMWEKSGHSRQTWTLWQYDGAYMRGCVSVFAKADIIPEMVQAIQAYWNHGNYVYDTRAIFAQVGRDGHNLLLLWADGKLYNPPITFEHESFNLNPGNDQSFMRRLPGMLDDLKADRPKELRV